MDFHGGSDGEESACNSGDPGLIPGFRKSPGGGSGNTLQYSCLENSVDRVASQVIVHGFSKSQTQLNNFHFSLLFSAICKASSSNHLWFLAFLFLWNGYVHHLMYNAKNLCLQFFRHPVYQIYPHESIHHLHCIIIKCLI